jgi:hypothetical protein
LPTPASHDRATLQTSSLSTRCGDLIVWVDKIETGPTEHPTHRIMNRGMNILIGWLSYFFLILYVWEYLRPAPVFLGRERNLIACSAFFLILGLLARARGVILFLSEKTRPADKPSIGGLT